MPTIKNPFSIGAFGYVGVVDETSADYYDQAIELSIKIAPGELPLDPNFGTQDPTFNVGEPVGLRATLTNFWPEISVNSITSGRPLKDGSKPINVDYEVENAVS
jgi:hypothetical protein